MSSRGNSPKAAFQATRARVDYRKNTRLTHRLGELTIAL
jgi:hypothetical protein